MKTTLVILIGLALCVTLGCSSPKSDQSSGREAAVKVLQTRRAVCRDIAGKVNTCSTANGVPPAEVNARYAGDVADCERVFGNDVLVVSILGHLVL
jgi:hypothetical protein